MRAFEITKQDRQVIDNAVEVMAELLTRIYTDSHIYSVGNRVHIHKATKKLIELKNRLHGITISKDVLPPETGRPIETEVQEQLPIEERPADALILHCEICALYDEQDESYRLHEQSEIAVLDEKALRLPLTWQMFGSINPKREIPSIWQPNALWQTLKCLWAPQVEGQGHSPWKLRDDKETQLRMTQGGPARLLTNRGWIEIDERGIKRIDSGEPLIITSDDKLPPVIVNGKGDIKEWSCDHPHCDKGPFKSKQALTAHSRVHKEKK